MARLPHQGMAITITKVSDNRVNVKNAAVVWPKKVKITICPPFEDRRFKFDAPEGWEGEITKDRRALGMCK